MHGISILLCLAATASAADLTGNWVISNPTPPMAPPAAARAAPPTPVKWQGDELDVWMRRNTESPEQELAAHRAPAGEGAMPAR
jgi:hypothetical protein